MPSISHQPRLGTLIGDGLCVRYLRREIAADVGPQLRQINLKIETLESVVNLALVTRYAELSAAPSARVVNGNLATSH
jgi:hypothetical protein